MSNGPESNTMRPAWRTPTPSSSRLATLKSLVSSQQRETLRGFFDIRSSRTGETGYVEEEQGRQSWKDWAGDKIRRRGSSLNNNAIEKLSLFPGWASRAYHSPESEGKEAAEFSLEVYVSGFAARYVPPEAATRSQKAFMRLAKAFAAIPKIPSPTNEHMSNNLSRLHLDKATEELLKGIELPPTPSEITEESEIEALEKHFRHADPETDSLSSTGSDASKSSGYSPPSGAVTPQAEVTLASANAQFISNPDELVRLHMNLNERLQPFWSRSLPSRSVRLSLYCNMPRRSQFIPEDFEVDPASTPIHVQETTTDQQGSFEAKIRIPWESICMHPGALQIAFGDPCEEYKVFVEAELLPNTNSVSPVAPSAGLDTTPRSSLVIPITQSRVRLISDIDDTIKVSNILGGARTIFRNVFVKHLEELVVKGMGEWYTSMWSRGVRFHYVSNGPFQLLPVISEFIRVSNLPEGSIKLRFYNGKSLFSGLLSAPAMRKRDGIVSILDTFSNSRFFLVGDSGEQDLELYAQIAAERHHQILAVFVRDASGPSTKLIDDPTGEEIKKHPLAFKRVRSFDTATTNAQNLPTLPNGPETSTPMQTDYMQTPTLRNQSRMLPSIDTSPDNYSHSKSPYTMSPPPPYAPSCGSSHSATAPLETSTPTQFSNPAMQRADSFSSALTPTSDIRTAGTLKWPGSLTKSEIANLPPAQRRRYELQERVYRARFMMPSHIPLRVFTEPEECVEANRILDSLDNHGDKRR